MSEVPLHNPSPDRFDVKKMPEVPYGNINLSAQKRQELPKIIDELGDVVVKIVVDAYFDMTLLDKNEPGTSRSHIDTSNQSFEGKITRLETDQVVIYRHDEADEYHAATSGIVVEGVDSHGARWQLYAPFEDLKGVYPPLGYQRKDNSQSRPATKLTVRSQSVS